jgi:hypothetical protein
MAFIEKESATGLEDVYTRIEGCVADKTHLNLTFATYVSKEAADQGKAPIGVDGVTFGFSKEDPKVQAILSAFYDLAKTSDQFKDATNA